MHYILLSITLQPVRLVSARNKLRYDLGARFTNQVYSLCPTAIWGADRNRATWTSAAIRMLRQKIFKTILRF